MQEITKLSINKKQLKEKFFYYNGCETDNINYASDVLIDILLREKS